MEDNMLHTNYMSYLQEVINICVNCPKTKCWEDSTTDASTLCPRFKKKREKIVKKYKRKKEYK